MKRTGELLFFGAGALALTLYFATAPDGLPWNASSHLSLAYLGEIVRLPSMPHPFWGYYVWIFGGAVNLAIACASVAAGLVGHLVHRHFGWRAGIGAALVWTFMPGVWNRAITGERSICVAATCVVALWALNAAVRRMTRRARVTQKREGGTIGEHALSGSEQAAKRSKAGRIAAWAVLGASALFAVVSLTKHDYRLGEAASAFARGVVETAGNRIIVLNGVCDAQVAREARGRAIFLRTDDAYRSNLVAWVRSEFPTETNLWLSAQISPTAFLNAALERHDDRFHLMTGKTTTPEAWEKRWDDFRPYLKSSDPFVHVARRLFGHEGNAVANAMEDEKRAYAFYGRLYTEVDPGNISALANADEMIRRGCKVGGDERKTVREKLDSFMRNPHNRQHLREIVRTAGPIRADPARLAKMAEEARRLIAARVAAGEKIGTPPEMLSLVEWNSEMMQATEAGELAKAGRIARKILSNRRWRDFIPANVVMGTVMSAEGDYESSVAFFKAATATTNKVAAVVLNDYADALLHLGRLDEAEKYARRAVAESKDRAWLAQVTLAQILGRRLLVNGRTMTEEECRMREQEMRDLFRRASRSAPQAMQDRIRTCRKEYGP